MTSHHDTNHKRARGISRRQLLSGTGAGAALVLGCSVPAPGQCSDKPKVLKRGDQVEIDVTAEEVIQKAYDLGYEYEKEHGGCARCTVAACQDAIPFVPIDVGLFRASTCLDGGATPVSVQNCGAFTGSGMVIGHLCGSTRGETFEGRADLAHELLHKVYDRFKEHYGTVLCRDVRKGAEGDCPKVVGLAAQWVAEVVLAEFTDYEPPKEPEKEKPQEEKPETKKRAEKKAEKQEAEEKKTSDAGAKKT